VLGSVCASDVVSEAVEDAQYTLGEGPCIDAYHRRAPVLGADLAEDRPGRWPAFSEGALSAGIRAAFGFPLLVGRACIGALNLYHDAPGALTDEQSADALVVAHVLTRTILAWQSDASPGKLARQLERVPAHLAVVHQATGMITVHANVSLDDALLVLRAHAFAEGRPISAIATDVVEGRLRLD
jgi:GAF domain-containing protein